MENNLSIVKDQFKELPNNIEAEQAVIGSILVSNDIFDEINTIISNVNLVLTSNFNRRKSLSSNKMSPTYMKCDLKSQEKR